jgi:hypothetical protein
MHFAKILPVSTSALLFVFFLLAASSWVAASSSAYRIQVLHPNSRPVVEGDELTFLAPAFGADDDDDVVFGTVPCPVQLRVLRSAAASNATSPAPTPQLVHATLLLEQPDVAVPVISFIMHPALTYSVAAGSAVPASAEAVAALRCSASRADVAREFSARAVLSAEDHNGVRYTLAESPLFVLRVLCGAGGLISSLCAGESATVDRDLSPGPAVACELQHASAWSPSFTSAGKCEHSI